MKLMIWVRERCGVDVHASSILFGGYPEVVEEASRMVREMIREDMHPADAVGDPSEQLPEPGSSTWQWWGGPEAERIVRVWEVAHAVGAPFGVEPIEVQESRWRSRKR